MNNWRTVLGNDEEHGYNFKFKKGERVKIPLSEYDDEPYITGVIRLTGLLETPMGPRHTYAIDLDDGKYWPEVFEKDIEKL